MVDLRLFAFFQQNLDDIEAPREIACFEQFEPCVGTALDEPLFGFVDRIEWTDFGVAAPGFNFNKKEQSIVSGDDVDFAAARAFEISLQDPVAVGAEKIDSDAFAVFADPLAVAGSAIRGRQAAGRVEPPAETSDDDGDKGRVSEALQDVLWCHNLGVSQSRIVGTHGRFLA